MPSIWPPVAVKGPTGVQAASLVNDDTTPVKPVEVTLGAARLAISMLESVAESPPATKLVSVSVAADPGALTRTSVSAPPMTQHALTSGQA
jgi:hypothetical protein